MAKVQEKLKGKVDALLVTTLDDIDWLLNMRGNDIECNPVFFAYVIIRVAKEADDKGSIKLFIKKEKVTDESV